MVADQLNSLNLESDRFFEQIAVNYQLFIVNYQLIGDRRSSKH
jgi:hypothetical protein